MAWKERTSDAMGRGKLCLKLKLCIGGRFVNAHVLGNLD